MARIFMQKMAGKLAETSKFGRPLVFHSWAIAISQCFLLFPFIIVISEHGEYRYDIDVIMKSPFSVASFPQYPPSGMCIPLT